MKFYWVRELFIVFVVYWALSTIFAMNNNNKKSENPPLYNSFYVLYSPIFMCWNLEYKEKTKDSSKNWENFNQHYATQKQEGPFLLSIDI